MGYLEKYLDQLRIICQRTDVKSLFAFGSVVRNDFKADSDIDLIVDIAASDPLSYADKYFDLKFALEKIFRRKIDLLEEKSLDNPYLMKQINQTKVLIYEGPD